MIIKKDNPHIIVLGTSFDTGNLGVSALAWSCINLLHKKWPKATISLVGNSSIQKEHPVILSDSKMEIPVNPIRFSSNIFTRNHFIKLLFAIIFFRIFPFLKPSNSKGKSTLATILKADLIVDITAGDSFSDIYGFSRFFRLWLEKKLLQITKKPFIMLPQTYGPFASNFVKNLAKSILKNATAIFSRDEEGIQTVKSIINTNQLHLYPDIAFTLEPQMPSQPFPSRPKDCDQLIGLNISGLLYNKGYTGNNEFNLHVEYNTLIRDIIEYFTSQPSTQVMLAPHVVSAHMDVENDLYACRALYDSLPQEIQEKIIIPDPQSAAFYDQCEIKYIIGQCDFFLGSRMHSTIAAISQCIPTIGLAYSKKFTGVYKTALVDNCVIDLRSETNESVINNIKTIFAQKDSIKKTLDQTIPQLKEKVYSIFDDSEVF